MKCVLCLRCFFLSEPSSGLESSVWFCWDFSVSVRETERWERSPELTCGLGCTWGAYPWGNQCMLRLHCSHQEWSHLPPSSLQAGIHPAPKPMAPSCSTACLCLTAIIDVSFQVTGFRFSKLPIFGFHLSQFTWGIVAELTQIRRFLLCLKLSA